jgi:predicted acyltransferase
MFIYLLSAFVILNFSIKRNEFIKTNTKTWKIYGRTIGAYSLLILNTYFNNDLKQKEYNIGGLIVIIDALLGIESRYIASNTKC